MKSVIFSLLLLVFALPLTVSAQQSGSTFEKSVQNSNLSPTLQNKALDLKSKLVDEYGVDGFRFIKSGDTKTNNLQQKTMTAHELSQASGLDEYTIIIILAAIGAIAVILFIFK